MEEKVYRQRRNLMITCFGVMLFYIGPGDFNEIGLLKNLGLHTLEPWQLKSMILTMLLYYSWRYYQYCLEYPSAFKQSVIDIIQTSERRHIDDRFRGELEEKLDKIHADRDDTSEKLSGSFGSVKIEKLLGDWDFTYETAVTVINLDNGSIRGVDHRKHRVQLLIIDLPYKLKVISKAIRKKTGFTDWIMPWLFFWLTLTLIIINELFPHIPKLLGM